MGKYHTEQRNTLLSFFEQNSHNSYSAREILSAIPNEGISLSSIYRNLKAMETEGIICKTNDPKQSEARYHYLKSNNCIGVIHLKCETCDQIYHLNPHVSDLIFTFAKGDLDFILNQAGAFLYGRCSNCSQVDSN